MVWRVDAVAANMGAMAAMASSKWRNRPPNNERRFIYLLQGLGYGKWYLKHLRGLNTLQVVGNFRWWDSKITKGR